MNWISLLLSAVDAGSDAPSPYQEDEWELEPAPAPQAAPAPAPLMVGMSLDRITTITKSLIGEAERTHNDLVDELARVKEEARVECERLAGEINRTLTVIAGQKAALNVFEPPLAPANPALSPQEFADKIKANAIEPADVVRRITKNAAHALAYGIRPNPYVPETPHEKLFPNAPRPILPEPDYSDAHERFLARRDPFGRLPSDDGADPSPI